MSKIRYQLTKEQLELVVENFLTESMAPEVKKTVKGTTTEKPKSKAKVADYKPKSKEASKHIKNMGTTEGTPKTKVGETKKNTTQAPEVKKNMSANKKTDINEGWFTTSWASVIKGMQDPKIKGDWRMQKVYLIKAIEKANTNIKGWALEGENSLQFVNDAESFNQFVSKLGERPGNDLEDKLAGKTRGGAATTATGN